MTETRGSSLARFLSASPRTPACTASGLSEKAGNGHGAPREGLKRDPTGGQKGIKTKSRLVALSRGFALTPLEPLPIPLGDDGRGGGDEAREASEGRDGCFTRLLRTASDGSAA